MSYSLNIKGKVNPKDKQLVKLEMVFFKADTLVYPRFWR